MLSDVGERVAYVARLHGLVQRLEWEPFSNVGAGLVDLHRLLVLQLPHARVEQPHPAA